MLALLTVVPVSDRKVKVLPTLLANHIPPEAAAKAPGELTVPAETVV